MADGRGMGTVLVAIVRRIYQITFGTRNSTLTPGLSGPARSLDFSKWDADRPRWSAAGRLPVPPDGATGRFTPTNLQYGYTIRNLTALQMLKAIQNGVMY